MKRPLDLLAHVSTPRTDDPVLQDATEVARATGASVTVADFVPLDDASRWEQRLESLAEQVRHLRARGVDAQLRLSIGTPRAELARMTATGRYGLVLRAETVETAPLPAETSQTVARWPQGLGRAVGGV